jgi:ATP-dependent helicase/DNAse subunit B
MLRAAYGLESPPVGEVSRHDIRAHETVMRLLGELRGWSELEGSLSTEELVAALERAEVRRASAAEPGRVAVLDLLRARTRRFGIVFVLGLEEGRLPRRGHESPFLADDVRRELDERSRARLSRPDHVARDRYLFYTACTRATKRVYLAREAAGDDGSPRSSSPFWDEVVALFPADDVQRWTRRRPLSQLTWPLEAAPTERERLRAVAMRAPDDRAAAEAIAAANGWERRLTRALRAFERPTRLTHPAVLAELSRRTTFNVTELERFVDCSSMWFLDRMIDPKTMDREPDARMRGSIAHQALYRFYSGLPKQLGIDRVGPDELEAGLGFLRRCLDEAVDGVRMELTELQQRELRHGLWRDLEAFVREDAAAASPLVPRRFEVAFGTERAASELQRGLELADRVTLSGKIDRIDVDPFSARGIVQDYKAGKRGHSARRSSRSRSCRSRCTCSSCAISSGSSRSAAFTGRWRASANRGACCAPRRATTACQATRPRTTSKRRRSGARSSVRASSRSESSSAFAAATSGTTRRAATAPRGASLADVPGEAARTSLP